jgi:hypothetical protein
MAAKLTRLTHKIAIQLHLMAESCTICSSRSRRPVRKLLDTPSYWLSSSGVLWFDSRRGLGILLFTTASRMALGPTQPPIQWVPGSLSLGVKRPGREAYHSPPSSAEVKEWVELYIHSPNTPSWRGAQMKHGDNFTFTFTLLTKLPSLYLFLYSSVFPSREPIVRIFILRREKVWQKGQI